MEWVHTRRARQKRDVRRGTSLSWRTAEQLRPALDRPCRTASTRPLVSRWNRFSSRWETANGANLVPKSANFRRCFVRFRA